MAQDVTVGETDDVGARRLVVRVGGRTVLSATAHEALAPLELADLLREYVSARVASLPLLADVPRPARGTAHPQLRVMP